MGDLPATKVIIENAEKANQDAHGIEARKCMILASHASAVTFLESKGVKHLMVYTFRSSPVLKQKGSINIIMRDVSLFNFTTGSMETSQLLVKKDTVPAHTWFVGSLLTGKEPTCTVFEHIIRTWEMIVAFIFEEPVTDEDATEILYAPLMEHAYTAGEKYIDLLLCDTMTRFNKTRLEGVKLWMQDLVTLVKRNLKYWKLAQDNRRLQLALKQLS